MAKVEIFAVILMSIFCLGCLPKAPIGEQEKADMLYTKAATLQEDEEYARAMEEFKAYVAKYPKSDDADNAQLEVGNGYRIQSELAADPEEKEKLLDQAILAYKAAVGSGGDIVDLALIKIGDAYFAKGERKEAIVTYKNLVDKYPYLSVLEASEAANRLEAIELLEDAEEDLKTLNKEVADNAQFRIANLYFNVFGDYDKAIKEFEKVLTDYPDSELADNAMWMIGECYWEKGGMNLPPKIAPKKSQQQEAFARLHHITDRYPQFSEMDRYEADKRPPWPAGQRGDRYEMYFAEVRRLLSRYPQLKDWRFEDFIPSDYAQALNTWNNLVLKYPNTDAAAVAPENIAQKLAELGKIYYNIGMADFASVLFKEALITYPNPATHIYMAYYYADVCAYTKWTYYRTRAFLHLKEAEKLVKPNSDLALDLKKLKTWLNYRLRVESLEAQYYNLKAKR